MFSIFKKKKETTVKEISNKGLTTNLIKSLLFVVAITAFAIILKKDLIKAFNNNPYLNSLILVIFSFGLFQNLKNIIILFPELKWVNNFFWEKKTDIKPKLLSPIESMLRGYKEHKSPYLSLSSVRSILDIIDSKISDYKDSSKYFVNILVFIGLLGTFWGLLITIGSISGVISSLEITNTTNQMFSELKQNLSTPLNGMGIAFSSSLLGLSASLILGFLHMQATLAQNYFYCQIEEKLSSLTRIVGSEATSEGNIASILPYIQALLEQTAEHLNSLQKTMKKNEEVNLENSKSLSVMSKEIKSSAEQMHSRLKTMEKMTKSNEKLMPILANLVKVSKSGFGMDEKTKIHIKNMDSGLKDLQEVLSEDIKLLAKTISITSDN